jgi:hypothetical protein
MKEKDIMVKYDQKKVATFGLMPPFASWFEAMNYGLGAIKYASRNWEKGSSFTRLFNAALRHIHLAMMGEWVDEEYKLPHVIMACFSLKCLNEFFVTHPEYNDLPKYTPEQLAMFKKMIKDVEEAAEKVRVKYEEKSAHLKKE